LSQPLTPADLYRAISATGAFPPDAQQQLAVERPHDEGVFIVAGPGTGKTSCLVARILKILFCDQVPPAGIVATTFTVKAAEELRSRILSLGFNVTAQLAQDQSLTPEQRAFAAQVDVNQVWTGTLDSLCEELLRDHRPPGGSPPVLADDFASKTIMLKEGLLDSRRFDDPALQRLLLRLHGSTGFGFNVGKMGDLLLQLWQRRHMDLVNWPAFLAAGSQAEQAEKLVANVALTRYEADLRKRGLVDFTLLEARVLELLRAGALKAFTDRLSVLLVDEYQDTNLLQEQLYFELAQACGGALTVVGDDDQSLYRFRGATVDLFSNFQARYTTRFQKASRRTFLSINYRFTAPIKDLVNGYATLDAAYGQVRVAQKPALSIGGSPRHPYPVIGIFEPNLDDLAAKLASFLSDVFQGGGHRLPSGDLIIKDPHQGAIGDCALLASTPEERGNPTINKNKQVVPGAERLPLKLKECLADLPTPIEVFNPRGEEVADRDLVKLLGGYLAELIDVGARVESTLRLPQAVVQVLREWRDAAIAHHNNLAVPSFKAYAQGWAQRTHQLQGGHKGGKTKVWPTNTSVLELVYGIAHYFPALHDDPEGQLYLEVFTRQLTAAALIGSFGGELVHDPTNMKLSDASVAELLRSFLVPIASGLVTVNEELIESFPRDRLSILSIHQSKGLEFPLTIVDVGSTFKTNHRAHAFKRFPAEGSTSHRLEDLLRPFSQGLVPSPRTPVDRAFDDLYRQYFVAFSRPQDVLVLAGLDTTLPGGIQNVATGWPRRGACAWVPNAPFIRI